MPKSQTKKISDMLALIKSDEVLLRKFAKTIMSAIEYDSTARNELSKIVSKEMGEELTGF